MRVVLLQKVKGLGEVDEVRQVADGYARNFLFPKHLAVPVSEKELEDIEFRRKKKDREDEFDLRHKQKLAESLDGLEIELREKVSVEGTLYAAVNAPKLALKLKELGFLVDKNQIELAPIKAAGSYQAVVKLPHGLEATLTVIVNPEKEPDKL